MVMHIAPVLTLPATRGKTIHTLMMLITIPIHNTIALFVLRSYGLLLDVAILRATREVLTAVVGFGLLSIVR
jgi:hypothetical protein